MRGKFAGAARLDGCAWDNLVACSVHPTAVDHDPGMGIAAEKVIAGLNLERGSLGVGPLARRPG